MKKILIPVLLILLLVFSGCIQVHITQKIHSNYNSDVEIEMDMSGIAGMMDSMDSNYCDDLDEEGIKTMLSNFKCEVDKENYIAKFSGTFSLIGTGALKIEPGLFNTKYIYDASKGQEFLDSMNSSDSDIDSPIGDYSEMTEAQIKQMKAMGVELTYTVEMPGTITKTEVGEIKDNKVVIDLLEASGKENYYIESEEPNFVSVIAIAVAVILVLALVFIFLLKPKKNKPQEFYGKQTTVNKNFQEKN